MGGAGFEPAKASPPDLQSGPFGRSGIPPHLESIPKTALLVSRGWGACANTSLYTRLLSYRVSAWYTLLAMPRADASSVLDAAVRPPLLGASASVQPLYEWELCALGRRVSVRVPSAWEDYGVPHAYEGPCDYIRTFTVVPQSGRRYWLHFGGASYEAQGFLNDVPLGVHKGIWDSFCWEITDALRAGENHLRVQVVKNGGATYPVPQVLSGFLPYVSCAFGGLWQPVYVLETGEVWLCDIWVRGEADGRVLVAGELGGALPATVRLSVYTPNGRAVAETQFEIDTTKWTHEVRITSPQAWSPTHPRLYRLVAEVWHRQQISHRVETEFGLRTVAVDGATIMLNGEPLYPRGVLHWGWYLHTHAPNPDRETVERELRAAQRGGFNLLKACLWVPSREYLSVCDRLGMLVWLELPLWLPQMDAAWMVQVQREYEAIVRQVRNHPSIVLWTLGCELSACFSSEALGELYGLVKRLTGSPLVRDNSGGGECYDGMLQEHADFADYHLYSDAHFARTTFRAFLDAPRTLMPWLQGEFADHDTMRDFQTLRQSVPAEQLWWLARDPAVNPQGVRWFYETPFVEERLQQAGLWESLPELVRASRCEMVAYHKLVLETMRSLPGTSGYVLTGLKDTPISTAGILDERGEPKVALEEYLAFNADTVLLLDWHRRRDWVAGGDRPANPDPYNHFGGRVVYPRLSVSHYGAPIENAILRWRLESADGASCFQSGEVAVGRIRAGVSFLTQVELPLPDTATPISLRFAVKLLAPSGKALSANEWLWGVYPTPDWRLLEQVAVYDPTDALWGLPTPANFARLHAGEAPTRTSVLLTTHLEPAHTAFLKGGGGVLWLLTTPTVACQRVPFWREATHRLLSHPLWETIPHPDRLDARLFAFSTDFALQTTELLGCSLRPIWQRVDTRTGYTHSYLAEVQVGAGRLLVSTLHFAGHHGDTPITLGYHPAGQYWLWAMLRYLASR